MLPAYDALKTDPSRAVSIKKVRARLAAQQKTGSRQTVRTCSVVFTPEAGEQMAKPILTRR
jgi:hypothetical protein